MTYITAVMTANGSIVVAADGRGHIVGQESNSPIQDGYIKYHSIDDTTLVLAAGQNIADDFHTFMGYLERIVSSSGDTLGLQKKAELIGNHCSLFWDYAARGSIFDIIIAGFDGHPGIFLYSQKSNNSPMLYRIELPKIFISGGLYKEADKVFDDFFVSHKRYPSEKEAVELIREAMNVASLHSQHVGGIATILLINKSGLTELERYLIDPEK